MNFRSSFLENGVTPIFTIPLGAKIKNLQELIYRSTESLIIDHDPSLDIIKKLQLPFKCIPKKNNWSEIMKKINSSKELSDLTNSQEVKNCFEQIFENPKKYEICTFRARYPQEGRVVYNWHQDEGTWYMSKNKNILNKFTATMWLSVNGSNEKNSIEILKKSHEKNKLYNHSFVEGQGYFKAQINDTNLSNSDNKITIKCEPSQAVMFHPLTLHRSIPMNKLDSNMRPRYSIDIRYFDDNKKLKYKPNFIFKLKKLFKI